LKRLFADFAISVLFLLLSIQLLLPLATSLALSRAARGAVGPDGHVKVEVSAFPAVKILWGQLDRMTINMEGVRPGGIPVSRLATVVDGARLDIPRLLGLREVAVLFRNPASISVAFSGADLSSIMRQRVSGLKEPAVSLVPGGAVISGKVSLVGVVIPVEMSGVFQTNGPKDIRFVPEQLRVSEYSLPAALEKRLLSRLQFQIGVDALPFDIEVDRVLVEGDYLTVTGSSRGRV